MGAEAYATGDKVAFAHAPSLHTAAHEAAHVVQQRGGVQLKGGVGAAGDAYEVHADQVADAVVQGKSAEGLLSKYAGGTASTRPVQQKVVQRDLTPEQRTEIEARTGPLEARIAGPGQVTLTAVQREALERTLGAAYGAWHGAAHTAIINFVRDQDTAANYTGLIAAILGAPLGIIGAAVAPLAIPMAVAAAGVSVLAAIPSSGDRVAAFRDRMLEAYDRVFENRTNSLTTMVNNWAIDLTPARAADQQQMQLSLIQAYFPRPSSTGITVNVTHITTSVYNAVKAVYDTIEAERERSERDARNDALGEAYGNMDYCWVAREVIPARWTEVRTFILSAAPSELRKLYGEQGPRLAKDLRDQPNRRAALRPLFTRLADLGRALEAGSTGIRADSSDLAELGLALGSDRK